MLLVDVNAGSNTPKLVSRILAWREQNPEIGIAYFHNNDQLAHKLWGSLNQVNMNLTALFSQLSGFYQDPFYTLIQEEASKRTASEVRILLKV